MVSSTPSAKRDVAGRGVLEGVDGDRFLARQIPRGVERVDADVHQGAATGERLVQAPLLRVADAEAGLAQDDLRLAELLLARHPDHRHVVRLVPQAIADHQLLPRRLRRRDHRLAVLRRVGHRLLAQHVLAGLVRAHRVLGMHAVGQHDVHDVDVGVVLHPVVRVVAVEAGLRHAVRGRQRLRLGRVAAHQRRHPRMSAVRERRQDLVDRQTAEADDGKPQLLLGRPWQTRLRSGADARERRGREGEAGGLEEVTSG